MKKKVEKLLIEMGVYPNIQGFDYICEAVKILSSSKEKMKIVDGLYADIARKFDSTKSRVERAIRWAISRMDKDSEAYKKYIGVKDPTNSAVLYALIIGLKEN